MVVVIGLGATGLSCVNFLLAQGITPRVMDSRANPPGSEQLPAGVELTVGLDAQLLCQAQLIVASPGVALATPALAAAAAAGVEIIGDIELFVRACRAPIIAITGSNGKSTVTTLVGDMLRAAGLTVGVGGNIGTPALDLLAAPLQVAVLELSSFQLETTHSLQAAASVILNLSEDHLDRYAGRMDLYRAAKLKIHAGSAYVLANGDDAQTYPAHGAVQAGFALDDAYAYGRRQINGRTWLIARGEPVLPCDELHIVGSHNHANALAALALCDALSSHDLTVPRSAQISALRAFRGLPHRACFVREVNGVRYINDSKATNVGATLAAVAGVREAVRGRLLLLAGGQGKGQDFSPLLALLGRDIDHLLCFGQDGAALCVDPQATTLVADLASAVEAAAAMAQPGDWILLAPACASLDQFSSYAARGDAFADLVAAL
ncbi:MAG: UDP-N-acetylmuramoyl-L-alanine--D-glutamate ligase [Aeromonas sp.]